MESYNFVRVISRKNKEGKDYFLAIVLYSNSYDSELIRVLVTKDVAEQLVKLDKANELDLSKCLKVTYNTYQKKYVPTIKF